LDFVAGERVCAETGRESGLEGVVEAEGLREDTGGSFEGVSFSFISDLNTPFSVLDTNGGVFEVGKESAGDNESRESGSDGTEIVVKAKLFTNSPMMESHFK